MRLLVSFWETHKLMRLKTLIKWEKFIQKKHHKDYHNKNVKRWMNILTNNKTIYSKIRVRFN